MATSGAGLFGNRPRRTRDHENDQAVVLVIRSSAAGGPPPAATVRWVSGGIGAVALTGA